jgi:endonuclease/exonuclease/phosphatase family metal-dependent hydrolase
MEQIINMALTERPQTFWRYENMKRKKMKILTVLMAIALGASFWPGAPTVYADDIYVTKVGCPDPDGSADKPYHVVESAIFRAKSLPGSTIIIEGGKKYYEMLTIDTPCTLNATGGPATIGKMDYKASTTLDIITLNTHLAGDEVIYWLGGLPWRDCDRANDIAHFFAKENLWPDVVGFTEIWDEDFFLGDDCVGRNGQGLYREAGYGYGRHGEREGDILNSGLALMSKYPLLDFRQWEFHDEDGEWNAAKGWVKATIKKGDFDIGLFCTHTYAGDPLMGYNETRNSQLTELREAINEYRSENPRSVVFLMGDLNVYGELWEYDHVLIPRIGIEAGGMDADRNSPGFIFGSTDQYTCSRSNPLAIHWDRDTVSGRLDYIFYFPSFNRSVEVMPTAVDVVHFTGRNIPACVDPEPPTLCHEWQVTNESSDHWAVHGKFRLIRTK